MTTAPLSPDAFSDRLLILKQRVYVNNSSQGGAVGGGGSSVR
jgi:hypothetical protein